MLNVADAPALERARAALTEGNWPHAYALFIDADGRTPLAGRDLELLAAVAYATGHFDVTIDAWERAHAAGVRAGDSLAAAAAAVRVAMHLLFDTALMAPVRGWLARAERLLDGSADTPVHAWLAAVRSYERLLSGDFGKAREWARRAVEAGTGRDPAAVAIGRLAEARSLVLQGDVSQGLELLNEAAVATVSGEIDPLSTGVVYCELVCALHALGQYDLAEQWTEAMERWHQGQPVGSLHGRCRVHRAEVLRLRGLWPARGMVADPAFHLMGWTAEKTAAYLKQAGRFTDADIDSLIFRMAAWPAQLTAYDTGALEFVRLRRQAEEALGDRFDLREFHRAVLENGTVTLPMLRRIVERWIEAKRAG
jgi:hypothetical protein